MHPSLNGIFHIGEDSRLRRRASSSSITHKRLSSFFFFFFAIITNKSSFWTQAVSHQTLHGL